MVVLSYFTSVYKAHYRSLTPPRSSSRSTTLTTLPESIPSTSFATPIPTAIAAAIATITTVVVAVRESPVSECHDRDVLSRFKSAEPLLVDLTTTASVEGRQSDHVLFRTESGERRPSPLRLCLCPQTVTCCVSLLVANLLSIWSRAVFQAHNHGNRSKMDTEGDRQATCPHALHFTLPPEHCLRVLNRRERSGHPMPSSLF